MDSREKWSFPAIARIVCWWPRRRALMTRLRCRPNAVRAAALAMADRLPANLARMAPLAPALRRADRAALEEDKVEVARRQNRSLRSKSAWFALGLIKEPSKRVRSVGMGWTPY